jgi:predicted DCC family thiol-disulfide oxidoreductase YuxK
VNQAENPRPHLLVIFDGHCGLCNRSVRWLLRHDRLDRLRFVPSDSPLIAALLARHRITRARWAPNPETILVAIDPCTPSEQLLSRSTAVLAILRHLHRPWPAISAALGWIPRPLRDLAYRLVARWRYRVWGRLETCPIPAPDERKSFL